MILKVKTPLESEHAFAEILPLYVFAPEGGGKYCANDELLCDDDES